MRELRGDWRDLFNNFAVALDPRKMFLGLFGMIVSFALLGLWCGLWDYAVGLNYFTRPIDVTQLPAFFGEFYRSIMLQHSFVRGLMWVGMFYFGFSVIFIMIWSYLGGAMTRIAAVEIAKDERIDLHSALQFGTKKYSSYFWSQLTCILIFLFFMFVIFVPCLMARIPGAGPFLTVVLVAFMFLAILVSFLMTMVAIGGTFGHVLFSPAISAEGTDAFDAISRGFSYLFSQPWRYIWYQLVSGVYGAVMFFFVLFFSNLVIYFLLVAARYGMGKAAFAGMIKYSYKLFPVFFSHLGVVESGQLGTLETISTVIFTMWLLLFYGFVFSFIISYFYSSNTMIYFLLRKKVDNIDINEVYEEKDGEDEILEPTPASAPEVKK